MQNENETDFGYERIPREQKTQRVAEVFDRVATHYDLMNDVLSFGLHRLWKAFTVRCCQARRGQKVLDVAAGSGDIAAALARRVLPTGSVTLTDINPNMLAQGRARFLDQGLYQNIAFIEANAENLPFENDTFDIVTIAFGLRNITDRSAALRSMARVLKPGGQLVVLEFSKPALSWLEKWYDLYSFHIMPRLGEWITGDAASYQYLVESIRKHPDQETLLKEISATGLVNTHYHNLTGGIVAVHRGYRS